MQQIIDNTINPALAAHGGFVSLINIEEGKAFVELGGGCQGCAMSRMTLKAGIETMLTEEVPEITEVVDVTDHGGGANPYLSGDS